MIAARRTALFAAIAAATVLAACGGMMGSSSAPGSMNVALSAANEVPPNSSGGTGNAVVTLNGNMLSWNVTYSGLTGPATAGHFHGPAPAGSNAGVSLPFGSLASPITGSKELSAEQVSQVKAGLWYINLHTAANPGGEIRGQVK